MAECIVSGCPRQTTGRMRTCAHCRASMHRWEKRRPAEIVERAHNLQLYSNRMSQFAVVKDDEVQLKPREALERAGVMMFRQAKKKAKAKVLQLKLRKRA